MYNGIRRIGNIEMKKKMKRMKRRREKVTVNGNLGGKGNLEIAENIREKERKIKKLKRKEKEK